MLVAGCEYLDTTEPTAAQEVHFSCTTKRCVPFNSAFHPTYDTTGLNLQTCDIPADTVFDVDGNIIETTWVEHIELRDTLIFHSLSSSDATDQCYKYIGTNTYNYSIYYYGRSCYCEPGIY